MECYVSVLVPVYNVTEKLLRKCIESLVNQSLSEIEIILVNDGSTDSSGIICDEYANTHDCIKVIHQSNQGISAARNTAFRAASGEYITFVDGDDWISPNTCESAYHEAKEDNLTILLFSAVKEYSKSSTPVRIKNIPKNKLLIGNNCKILQQKVLDFNSLISNACGKLIKRSYLVEYSITHNERLRQGAEGIEFNMRLFDKVDRAKFVDELWYHRTYNDKSITYTHSEKNHYYALDCFREIFEFICANNKRDLEPLFYIRMLYLINTTAISGYFNPSNGLSYTKKKYGFATYLENELVKKALSVADASQLSLVRRVNIVFIKRKWFRLLDVFAKVRRLQHRVK